MVRKIFTCVFLFAVTLLSFLNAQENQEQEVTVITFLDDLYSKYHYQIYSKWGSIIDEELQNSEIDVNQLKEKVLELYFLHKLLTCSSCIDGNNTGIWKIPYFWHWRNPNIRCEIITLPDSTKLNEISPPQEYSLYESFAYLDRKPLLYLSDLFTNPSSYYHKSCGEFQTFGWCSEREMAYNAILKINGIDSKIVAEYNHSWSEAYLQINNTAITIKIDNTFDNFKISKENSTLDSWKKAIGDNPRSEWYNKKAEDEEMLSSLKKLKVFHKNQIILENMIREYFSIP